jgi:hypothetical protein
MNETAKRDRNALIRRVDELAQRQQAVQVGDEVPLLTEIVEPVAPDAPKIPVQELEDIAAKLEQTVLEQIGPEIDRAIEAAHANLKTEIASSVRRAVREALAPLGK